MRQLIRWMLSFTPMLALFGGCPLAALFFITQSQSNLPPTGSLVVDIDYDDDFYVETFNYSRDAENIRHYVMVMPSDKITDPATDKWIFGYLVFPGEGDGPVLREDRQQYTWALDYIYPAPGGHFEGEFEPGDYYIGVAFVAAPVSREEGGYDDDVILWAGVTGGGASTELQEIVIERGTAQSIEYLLTDANGWACPWVYVFNGRDFERRAEILRNVRGSENEQTETTNIGFAPVIDGAITLQLTEEKDEISYIDAFSIQVDGVNVAVIANTAAITASVGKIDGDYLIMRQGEAVDFTFSLPPELANRDRVRVEVVASGYYVPLD